MKTKEKMESRKGFTLVELVVVIAVLAILAGVGAVAYRGYITRAKEAKDMEILAAVKTAVDAATAERTTNYTSITLKSSDTYPTVEATDLSDPEKALYDEFMSGNKLSDLSHTGATDEYKWEGDKWTVPGESKADDAGGDQD